MPLTLCIHRPIEMARTQHHLAQQDTRLSRVSSSLSDHTRAMNSFGAVQHKMASQVQRLRERLALVQEQEEGTGRAAGLALAEQSAKSVLPLMAAFDVFDLDSSGGIDVSELRPALRALGLDADSAQVARVLKQYDDYPDQLIDVKEFAALVDDARLLLTFDTDGDGTLDTRELAAGLAHLGLQNVTAAQAEAVLRFFDADDSGKLDLVEFAALGRSLQTFARYDADGSGAIDLRELRPALRKLGLPVGSEQAEVVLRKYDRDESGQIELPEFAALARDLSLFREFDANGDGAIDIDELEHVLGRLGLRAVSGLAGRLLRAWDTDGNGTFDVLEFAQLVADVRLFREADTDGDGTLDAEELLPALRQLGVDVSSARAEEILASYDVDNSGGIELEEFASLMHDLPRLSAEEGGGRGFFDGFHDEDGESFLRSELGSSFAPKRRNYRDSATVLGF